MTLTCYCGDSFPNTVDLQMHKIGCIVGNTRRSKRKRSVPPKYDGYDLTNEPGSEMAAVENGEDAGNPHETSKSYDKNSPNGKQEKEVESTITENAEEKGLIDELNLSRAVMEDVEGILDVLDDLDVMLEGTATDITTQSTNSPVPNETPEKNVPVPNETLEKNVITLTEVDKEKEARKKQTELLRTLLSKKDDEITKLLKCNEEERQKIKENQDKAKEEIEKLRRKIEMQTEEVEKKEEELMDKGKKSNRLESDLRESRNENEELRQLMKKEKNARLEQGKVNEAMKILAEETTKELRIKDKEIQKLMEERKTSTGVKTKEVDYRQAELSELKQKMKKMEDEIITKEQQEEEIKRLLEIQRKQTEEIDQLKGELSIIKLRDQKSCENVSDLVSELRSREEVIESKDQEITKITQRQINRQ